MGTDRILPLKPVSTVQPHETSGVSVQKTRKEGATATTDTSVMLSNVQAKLMQPGTNGISMERVGALKIAIRDGELKMGTGEIANSLIREVQSYLRSKQSMTRLSEIFDQVTAVLNGLKTVMDAEQQQLSVGHISGSQLQCITEEKSSLLAILDYFGQQRRLEHDVTRSADDEIAERWQTITKKAQRLRDLNQHNDWLSEEQIGRNRQAIQVLKPHQGPALCGANGQTLAAHRDGKKFSI